MLFVHRFRDNKKLKQGHFEMGIHYVNFMPISNRCARRRATLCPLAKCYQERHLTYILAECDNIKTAVVEYYGKSGVLFI
ncbi:hypothetical protein PLESHI_08954 [Plesiomonas shigelloides 302-73]|uniref:Uncharacterized protein n=1 Tax=Plesiomonas shigelloides 302-73 TaxID=1315976 RepID=R8AQZ5_PLESH|nr:hypothetical protein PLESHI_08954 [Plesiomonas shigelloides 302-73]